MPNSNGNTHEDWNNRDYESLCKECFDEHLRSKAHLKDLHWRSVKQDQQPPDFWLEMEAKTFAVEVTSIFPEVDETATTMNVRAYFSWWKNLGKAIEQEAHRRGILNRSYVLLMNRTPDVQKTRERAKIVNAALAYICETAATNQHAKQILYQLPSGEISIAMLDSSTPRVSVGGPTITRSEGAILSEARHLLQECVDKKRVKLEKVHAGCDGVILLIQNRNPLCDDRCLNKAGKKLENLAFFHSLFWVRETPQQPPLHKGRGALGGLLYCNEPLWLEQF